MNSEADVAAAQAVPVILRFEDWFVNMQEPLRQLAESIVNVIVSAEVGHPCGMTSNSRNS